MQRKQRLREMVSAIVEKGGLEVEDLAELFSVSAATVRAPSRNRRACRAMRRFSPVSCSVL